MKYMRGSCCLPTLFFFNPTLNIKMVFGEKIHKIGIFFKFCHDFLCKMLKQNLIISLPTYPKCCWYVTGTTHIFHLGLLNMGGGYLVRRLSNIIKMTTLCD